MLPSSVRKHYAAVIMLSLCVMTACGSTDSKQAMSTTQVVDIALSDFMIVPHDFTAKAGKISFAVHNNGKSPHNLAIEAANDEDVAVTKTLGPGDNTTLNVDLEAGKYTVLCEVPGHASLGMKGVLTIDP